jgi:ribosome-associated heat shock protein Hsp15
MRIDKYLWSTRYYKTRSQASQACRKGAVKVNDAIVKPSRDVYQGDQIALRKGQVNFKLEVIDLPKSRVGAKLVDIYRKDLTPKEALATQEMLKLSQDYYRKKGSGRPTKKDRRDLEGFTRPEDDIE